MRKYKPYKDITGKKFGLLTALRFYKRKLRKDGTGFNYYWLFQCDCGKRKVIQRSSVISIRKDTRSCGCKKLKHGFARGAKKPFYRVWAAMIKRCLCLSDLYYPYYGGRGITVCKRWLDFKNFKEDMYESYKEHKNNNSYTSIDRIDNDGNYTPKNCRWATRSEQMKNRRPRTLKLKT